MNGSEYWRETRPKESAKSRAEAHSAASRARGMRPMDREPSYLNTGLSKSERWRSAKPGFRLTTGWDFLQNLDAMRDSAHDKTQTFDGPARFAGEANHERLIHHDGQVP